MTERYIPNGTPLTDYERELLVILMEECAEVTQAASKLIRFGKENRPVNGETNTRALGLEVGDLSHMILLSRMAGLFSNNDILDGEERKCERLARYMQATR